MGQLPDTHQTQILAYPNANHRMAEIRRKVGFNKSAICKFWVLTQVECQPLVTLLFQYHFLGRVTLALEPKTKLLPIGNLVLWESKLQESFNDSLPTTQHFRDVWQCYCMIKDCFLLFGAYCRIIKKKKSFSKPHHSSIFSKVRAFSWKTTCHKNSDRSLLQDRHTDYYQAFMGCDLQ